MNAQREEISSGRWTAITPIHNPLSPKRCPLIPNLDGDEGILGQPALVVLNELRHRLLHISPSSTFLLEVQVVALTAVLSRCVTRVQILNNIVPTEQRVAIASKSQMPPASSFCIPRHLISMCKSSQTWLICTKTHGLSPYFLRHHQTPSGLLIRLVEFGGGHICANLHLAWRTTNGSPSKWTWLGHWALGM